MTNIEQFLNELAQQPVERVVSWKWNLRAWFNPVDRYPFDTFLLKNWYFQVDTEQDAHYYGVWINLKTLEEVVYAEWDVYYITFDTEEWLAKNIVDDTFRWIDGWLKDENLKLGMDFCNKYWIENYK